MKNGMTAIGRWSLAGCAAAHEEPDPEDGKARDVPEEHQQRPPRLHQEGQVGLLAQLEDREIDEDQQRQQEDGRDLLGEREDDHPSGHLT